MSLLSDLLKKHGMQSSAKSIGIRTNISEARESVTHLSNLPDDTVETVSASITYNAEQQAFINLATQMQSCVLIGAAGTGKTTCMKGTVASLIQSGKIFPIPDTAGHRYIANNSLGIILCSFTRRAVRNLRRQMSEDLKGNCITIHKLLEYQPIKYEVYDPESGEYKTTMRFEPSRHAYNKLPAGIRTVIIDESSMVSLELFTELCDALQGTVQFIFLGDIQQLPPVFGSAVLGYKMLEHPVIELTQVYRQALESPIIRLAHRILSGKPIPATELLEWKIESAAKSKLTLHPWKKKLHQDVALLTAAKFFTTAYDNNAYDPEEDMILCPFNKAFGTIEINKHIANHIAKKQGKIVHEVIAGFNKHYFSVGDKVLFEREDAVITNIYRNGMHTGKRPQAAATTLDYWGFNSAGTKSDICDLDLDAVDAILAQAASDNSERVTTSSHILTLEMVDSGEEVVLETAAEINALLLSYALTVHKSQGSEWRKVFIVLHQSHNTMVQRELLYTAVTRAREELYVICEPDHFTKGIESQRIPGNTLECKIEYFKGKQSSKFGMEE